jgi:glycosyltransferase involved in cell wall biosynthesis
MKVLYLNHTSSVSGAEHALLTLLPRLPHAIEPIVACPEGPLADAVTELGIEVAPVSGTSASLRLHPLHTPRAVLEIAGTATVVRSLARRTGTDLVHANSIRAGVIASGARRLGCPPVIVHLHDRLPRSLLSSASLRAVARQSDAFLACSKYVLEPLGRPRREALVRVVHNPVDTDRFDPRTVDRDATRRRLGLAPEEIAMMVVAQLTPWKAQDDAVKVLAALSRDHPQARLVLVGSPKFVGRATRYDNLAYTRELDSLIASLELESRVLRLGEREDIPQLLSAADIFLAPSWEEPFSLAVLEAMAMELPVVCTAIGGMQEAIDGDNGILLSPRNPRRWAAEVGCLLTDQAARSEMGKRARATVEERFTAPAWVDRVVASYEALANRDAPGPARVPARRDRRQRRVLYVNHTSHVGGGERSLLTLLDGLNGAVDVAVACPEGPLFDEVEKAGHHAVSIRGTEGSLKLHPSETPLAVGQLAFTARELVRASRAFDADLLHANSIRAGLSAGIAARISGTPAVVHLRDRLPAGPLAGLTYDLLSRTATQVVANSQYTADRYLESHASDTLHVVHNPVDLSRFEPKRTSRSDARRRLGLTPDQPVLGVVAQITPWKAQDDAVRIAAELKPRYPDLRLVIVGSAKFVSRATRFDNVAYLEELKELTRSLNLSDDVMFVGERQDVPEIMRALDVLLVPSWEEPFGRAIIEGMAMALPVIATNVGGPTEILSDGHDGILLPPRQPAAWACVVADLLDQPERRAELGRTAAAQARRRFGLKQHAAALLEIYDEILATRTTAPV